MTDLAYYERQIARIRDQLAILAGARPTPEQLAGEDTADKDMARRIHQARPGIPAQHVLATLKAFRAVLDMEPGTGPGYCPHCGRGDLAPTSDEYEQQRQRAERAEAAIKRVRALADQWDSALAPARSQYSGPVRAALGPDRPIREQLERPTHPDGTPYRYHEIVASNWGHCDACSMWGQWTTANPHQCSQTPAQGGA